jgi:4-amino-4-deoxy-L-arabinose transferase-like glycosyltransferase
MLRHLNHRCIHYAILTAMCLALYLPNLGAPSLWDIDEGNNVEAMREMLAADNWHVPTFNFQLRVDKPALLYWLQIFASLAFGIGEFAGRLPSALAALATVFTTYELGRKMYGSSAGLCAAAALASAAMFCAAAHFANPDALLVACTALTFFFFWAGLKLSGRIWFVPVNVMMALAVLAKGPVGVALPVTVIVLYLVLARQTRLLLNRAVFYGAATFLAVALPWYIWVGVDTKFVFLRGFIGTHNFGRFFSSMEGHTGPVYYYLGVLALGFAPWSVFLLPLGWHLYRSWKNRTASAAPTGGGPWVDAPAPATADRQLHPELFLLCWSAVYLVFFTISRTKLPNYILPMYPALALLIGRFLAEWSAGRATPPVWMMRLSFACLALIGVSTVVGLLLVGGVIPTPLLRGHYFPELAGWAWLGILPIAGAAFAAWCAHRGQRSLATIAMTSLAVLFLAPLTGSATRIFDHYKAPEPLAELIHVHQSERDVRVAAFDYFQPSLVYYCRREVTPLGGDFQACEFLRTPIQVFLITPAATWDRLATQVRVPCQVLGKRWDMYRNCEVVVVTNR